MAGVTEELNLKLHLILIKFKQLYVAVDYHVGQHRCLPMGADVSGSITCLWLNINVCIL